jgi:hypothetical protein
MDSTAHNNATIVNNITLGRTLGNATFYIQAIVAGVAWRV